MTIDPYEAAPAPPALPPARNRAGAAVIQRDARPTSRSSISSGLAGGQTLNRQRFETFYE